MLVHSLIVGTERMAMPVLFKEISADLGLNIVKIGTVWGMDPLAGILVGVPGGLLADRFGLKRTMVVLTVLCGVFSALRGFSVNFLSLAATMFLFGLVVAAVPSVVPKVTAVWFERRQLGMANAMLNVAWAVGSMFGTMTSATIFSPLLGGWRNVIFLFGVPGVIIGLLWQMTGRERPGGRYEAVTPDVVTLRKAASHVLRMKQVWLLGLTALTFWGANMGMMGYLPTYLRDIGWTPAGADGVLTMLIGITGIGALPMIIITEKFNNRKFVIVVSIIMMVIGQAALPFVDGAGVWALLVVTGFLRASASPLFNVMIFDIDGVGSTYGGTATGLMSAVGMAGAFIAPPLGNALANIDAGFPFLFWAGFSALGLVGVVFIKRQKRVA
jgi:MFS family permease